LKGHLKLEQLNQQLQKLTPQQQASFATEMFLSTAAPVAGLKVSRALFTHGGQILPEISEAADIAQTTNNEIRAVAFKREPTAAQDAIGNKTGLDKLTEAITNSHDCSSKIWAEQAGAFGD